VGVAVGGTGVAVDVGGTGVFVGGTWVAVGEGVAVGVAVGGTDVAVGEGVAVCVSVVARATTVPGAGVLPMTIRHAAPCAGKTANKTIVSTAPKMMTISFFLDI
jgi:hypothetical protein